MLFTDAQHLDHLYKNNPLDLDEISLYDEGLTGRVTQLVKLSPTFHESKVSTAQMEIIPEIIPDSADIRGDRV